MKIVLGTATFSDQVDESGSLNMLRIFEATKNDELDTAYQYCAGNTERLLGALLTQNTDFNFKVATKVNPWDGDGLQPREIRKQFDESLVRMQTSEVDTLYLHAPDLNTSIEESLATLWEYHKQGKFKQLGLSNFSAWQVAEAAEICIRNNWMKPMVYQGLYNALNRDVERELFPCLRNYNICFYAYNPLAGGMLTGKHKAFEDDPEQGRFDGNQPYLERYWKSDYFEAMGRFVETCARNSVSPSDAALRWLVHHSQISDAKSDGIILGASRISHLQANIDSVNGGPLGEDILETLDAGWLLVKPNCFKYFRP